MKHIIASFIMTVSLSASAAVITQERDKTDKAQISCTSIFKESWRKTILPGAALLAATVMTPDDTLAQGSLVKKTDGKIEVGICGGGENGTYIKLAQYLAVGFSGDVTFPWKSTVYFTRGTLENIDKMMSGVCQVTVLQADGVEVYKRNTRSAFVPFDIKPEPAFQEETQLLCHKDRQLRTIGAIAEKANKGEVVPIFAPSVQSGFHLTMSNLKAVREEYKNILLQPAPTPQDPSVNLVRNAMNLAKAQKGCFGIVSRVPDDFIVQNMDELAADFNLVDLYDRNVEATYKVKDAQGRERPLYTFTPYSKIRPNQPDLYLPLRKSSSRLAFITGDFDPRPMGVPALVAIHSDWQQNMLGGIRQTGAEGTIQAWNRSINTAIGLKGDFEPVRYLLETVQPQRLPQ